MTRIRFYDEADDARLIFAVIVARSRGKYVFCRHRDRDTWEIPGGHREPGENIMTAARRELYEMCIRDSSGSPPRPQSGSACAPAGTP